MKMSVLLFLCFINLYTQIEERRHISFYVQVGIRFEPLHFLLVRMKSKIIGWILEGYNWTTEWTGRAEL